METAGLKTCMNMSRFLTHRGYNISIHINIEETYQPTFTNANGAKPLFCKNKKLQIEKKISSIAL